MYDIYNINLDGDELGLYAVSWVDSPAIEQDFVYFKEQKPIGLYFFSGEKHEVVSPILIPNQLIYRNQCGYEFYVRWTAETIKQAFEKFKANGWLNRVTFMHSTDMYSDDYETSMIEDVYMKKAWIVEDSETDPINTEYGYNLPNGTLCVHYKVVNEDLWAKIKDSEVKGLSIEALCNFDKIQMKKQNKMTNTNLFQKFIQFLNDVKEDVEALDTVVNTDNTDSGEATVKYYIDETNYYELDGEGYVKDMEGQLVGEGEYKLADGNVLVVDAEGKFVETKEVTDAVNTEEPLESPIAEEKQEEDEDKKDEEPNTEDKEDEAPNNEETKEEEKDDEKKDETVAEEAEVEDDLVEITIEGEGYKVPSKVADYISLLEGGKADAEAENVELKAQIKQSEQTPSAKPIINTIMQNAIKEKSDEKVLLTDAFKRINKLG